MKQKQKYHYRNEIIYNQFIFLSPNCVSSILFRFPNDNYSYLADGNYNYINSLEMSEGNYIKT